MKPLKTFSKKINDLRDNMLTEIKNFFIENPKVEIDVEETEGSGTNIRGDKDLGKITKNGTVGIDGDFSFDELDLCDLDCLIDIINDFIVDDKKTEERCSD